MEKQLIFGVDCSINSTGICIYYLSDEKKKFYFYRIIYSDNLKKKNYFEDNINYIYYFLPINVNSWKITSKDSLSDREQMEGSLKGMMIKKIIKEIVDKKIEEFNFKGKIHFCIENYILPTYSGKTQLKTTGMLIGLNSYIREIFVELSITGKYDVKFYYPSPSHNKKSFTLNGNATKEDMEKVFIESYNGLSLLHNLNSKVDDLIDAFSLVVYCLRYIYNKFSIIDMTERKERNRKEKDGKGKKKKEKKDIYADTIILE
jgi:predicted DNA-binding ribbon-helix-helix protein